MNPFRHRIELIAILALTQSPLVAFAGDCEPGWVPAFGAAPGLNGDAYSVTVFDDGSRAGRALYVGGNFTIAGGVAANKIAKWNGFSWSPLSIGIDGSVMALTVFDDGSGPALYAGGYFGSAGGTAASGIAKWDGSTWCPLGSGLDGAALALTVYDDGKGPALYAGGEFSVGGGITVNYVAKWDGTSWSPLGKGMNNAVSALTVFDDGSGGGPALYAGGAFTTAGGIEVNQIAKWNGSSWSPLGGGMNNAVRALSVYDDGSGSGLSLYAGGDFTSAGGETALKIAKWNGSIWTPLAGEMWGSTVYSLLDFDDGNGPALYVGGVFQSIGNVQAKNIAKWDGSSWSYLGNGTNNAVIAMAEFDDGLGPALFAGGDFVSAGSVGADYIAKWNGLLWLPVGGGFDGSISALTVLDGGSGALLYTGGNFSSAGGVLAGHIAKLNGSTWSPLGGGMSGTVRAMTMFSDGSGAVPTLYAGGTFTEADGVSAHRIAKWNGFSWSPFGGVNGQEVNAVTVFDDGSGAALYVGGLFASAGGVLASSIAKWDGSTWSSLGSGLSWAVRALAVFDDGSGRALYVGGAFTSAGGVTANRIAKWNGSTWSPVGSGMNSEIWALTVFDDGMGGGSSLYAGGTFTTADGVTANRIAKWNGSTWSPLGSGVNEDVRALTVFNEGSGPALYAGGRFTSAGGVAANRIAKWDGSTWSPLGSGVSGTVSALAEFDDGSGNGPALYVGGEFTTSPAGDSYLAKWQGCPIEPKCALADITCDGVVNVNDLLAVINAWGPCPTPPLSCPADISPAPNGDGVVNVNDLLMVINNWG